MSELILIPLERIRPNAQQVRRTFHRIRRRFTAGRANFERIYAPLVDDWVLYDNTDSAPVLLDWGENR